MLDIKQLRQLAALYEAGTMTAAAKTLHISQPALSAHLSRLESRLGQPLFIRTVKGLEPTQLADQLYGQMSGMLKQWRNFEEVADMLATGDRGSMVVICGPVVMHAIMPDACLAFLQMHPEVDLTIDSTPGDQIGEQLLSGHADLAVIDTLPEEGLIGRPIETHGQRIVFCVRKDHPLLTMDDWISKVSDYPFAAPFFNPAGAEWIRRSGIFSEHRNVATNSYPLLNQVTKNTNHVTGGPEFIFAEEFCDGSLVELPLEHTPPWTMMVHMREAWVHSKMMANFVDCIEAVFKEKILGTRA